MKPSIPSTRPLFLPALLCSCLLLFGGCKQEAKHETAPAAQPAPTVSVQVVTAKESQSTSQNEVVGTIEAVQRATIAAKVTGTITEMPVVLGAMVKEGDLLIKLSAAEISARLSQAETAVAQAKRNLEREERLLSQNASTRETVNAMTDAYQLAKATQNEARTMLGYITLRAPFSGLISQKLANIGDMATVGAPLLILENTGIVQAVVAVPEAQLAKITPGDTLAVRVPAAKIETTGTVAEIAPANDTTSRTSLIKLDLKESRALRPGQFVRVILPGLTVTSLLVPETAVSTFGQMERIFVVENNIARLRLVRSGNHQEGLSSVPAEVGFSSIPAAVGRVRGQIEILSGLNPGEQVVVAGGTPLLDGQPVKVTP